MNPFDDPRVLRYEIVCRNGTRYWFEKGISDPSCWGRVYEGAEAVFCHLNDGNIVCFKNRAGTIQPELAPPYHWGVSDEDFEAFRQELIARM